MKIDWIGQIGWKSILRMSTSKERLSILPISLMQLFYLFFFPNVHIFSYVIYITNSLWVESVAAGKNYIHDSRDNFWSLTFEPAH